jgi:hypothetical protein
VVLAPCPGPCVACTSSLYDRAKQSIVWQSLGCQCLVRQWHRSCFVMKRKQVRLQAYARLLVFPPMGDQGLQQGICARQLQPTVMLQRRCCALHTDDDPLARQFHTLDTAWGRLWSSTGSALHLHVAHMHYCSHYSVNLPVSTGTAALLAAAVNL